MHFAGACPGSPSTAQVQDLCSLVKRAICMGTSDLLPAEAAALASLLQELQWLQQDTRQQDAELAAAAQQLICELAAAVPGSAGASAGMLDGALASRTSSTAAGTGSAAAAAAVAGAGVACSDAPITAPTAPAAAELHTPVDTVIHAGYEDSDLQLLLTQHPLAPSTLQQQLLESYAELLQQYRQQLQDTLAQQRLHAGQCRSWTPDQHALFTFFRAQALQGLTRSDSAPHTAAAAAASSAAGCGMSRGRSRGATGCRSHVGFKGSSSSRGSQGCSKAYVVDYLAVRMPGKTKQQLAEHETWCAPVMAAE